MTFSLYYKDGDTALDIISKAVEVFSTLKNKCTVRIFEFTSHECLNGEPLQNPYIDIPTRMFTNLSKQTGKQISSIVNDLAVNIESVLGVPHLVFPEEIPINCISAELIQHRLEKYRSHNAWRTKKIMQMYSGVKSSICTKTSAVISILEALSVEKDNTKRSLLAMSALKSSIISRERDKLFYIRRHPGEFKLHRCHHEPTLELVKVLMWCFNNMPFPLKDSRQYGQSTLL